MSMHLTIEWFQHMTKLLKASMNTQGRLIHFANVQILLNYIRTGNQRPNLNICHEQRKAEERVSLSISRRSAYFVKRFAMCYIQYELNMQESRQYLRIHSTSCQPAHSFPKVEWGTLINKENSPERSSQQDWVLHTKRGYSILPFVLSHRQRDKSLILGECDQRLSECCPVTQHH